MTAVKKCSSILWTTVPDVLQADYKKLARQLSDFTVKLLDKVRDGKELDTILNDSSNTPFANQERLARLKLAIRYGEKLVGALMQDLKPSSGWSQQSKVPIPTNFISQVVFVLCCFCSS